MQMIITIVITLTSGIKKMISALEEKGEKMTVQTASLKRIEDELKKQFPNVTVFSQESPLSPNCVEIRARAGKANAVVTLDFYTNGCSEDYIASVLAWKLKEVT